MSAILAILLMLSGALFVPRAFAQVPADAIQTDPLSINWTYPAHGPGETFTMYIDVINVVDLFSFQCGFRFDAAALYVISVAEGGFLSNNGVDTTLPFPGSIDNTNGIVTAYGWTLTDVTKAKSGNGHLLTVQMKIEDALWPPYSGTYPGSPVFMADINDTPLDPCRTKLVYKDGSTLITPTLDHLYDGYFTLSVGEADPVANFVWTPVPVYKDEVVGFDASSSTKGWNGYAWVDLAFYYWDWDGDMVVDETDTDASTPHTFTWTPPPDTMTFTVGLQVEDAEGRLSAWRQKSVQVITRPTGPAIDLQSQRWRYVDPLFWPDPYFGEGPDQPCDLFRPGDMVELWVSLTYNGDPVQNQLVAYEVRDNQDNIVLLGTAQSDVNGWAYYQFRVPWPCTGPEPYFGVWTAIAKWSIGEMDGKPWGITIQDTMQFKVGWGLWIVDKVECDEFGDPKGAFFKDEIVYVKLTIQNDYVTPVDCVISVTIYDDLMVPIGTATLVDYTVPGSGVWCEPYIIEVTLAIELQKWAYVGTGYAKANLFTLLPYLCGTSWCPEFVNTFVIQKTPGEPWVPDP